MLRPQNLFSASIILNKILIAPTDSPSYQQLSIPVPCGLMLPDTIVTGVTEHGVTNDTLWHNYPAEWVRCTAHQVLVSHYKDPSIIHLTPRSVTTQTLTLDTLSPTLLCKIEIRFGQNFHIFGVPYSKIEYALQIVEWRDIRQQEYNERDLSLKNC